MSARGEGPIRAADLRAEEEAGEGPEDEVPVLRGPAKKPEPEPEPEPAPEPPRPRKKKPKGPDTWNL